MVGLLIALATLSAYSIWQATERGDQAQRLRGEIELVSALQAVRDSSVEELIAFDLRLLSRFAASLYGRQSMMEVLSWREAGALDAEQRVLSGYFVMGIPSAEDILADSTAYDPEFVAGRARDFEFDRADSRIAGLLRQTDGHRTAQIGLLVGGVIFALGMACATLADLGSGTSWGRRAWYVGIALGLIGLGVVATWALSGLWLVIVAGGLYGLLRLLARRLAIGANHRSIAWYAELFGAVTVVTLSMVLVPLALAVHHENTATTEARQQQIYAGEALALAQQTALDDLDAAILVQTLETRWDPGFSGGPGSEVPQRVLEFTETTTDRDRDTSRGAVLRVLREQASSNAFGFIADHLAEASRPALAAYATAEMSRVQADDWGRKVANYTVALVLLGLAAYMFSLAGDRDRRRTTAVWVLSAGVVGLVLGVFTTGATLAQPITSMGSEETSEAYAQGQVALDQSRCSEAFEAFDRLLEASPEFDAALIDRALARVCRDRTPGIYSPSMSPADATSMIADLESYREGRGDDGWTAAKLGWGYLVRGIQEGSASDIERAIRLTRSAVAEDPSNTYYLFNLGLAELAAGREHEAQVAYETAVRCVVRHEDRDTVETCDGARREDDYGPSLMAMQALSDLQFLMTAQDRDLTSFKELVLRGLLETTEPRRGDGIEIESINVFPVEVQVTTARGSSVPDGEVSMFWYHRPEDGEHWGVVEAVSMASFREASLNSPVEAFMVLPEGDYRVEVYLDGYLVEVRETHGGFADLEHHLWRELGIQAALPVGWESVSEATGWIRRYADETGWIRFTALRLEGWPAPAQDQGLEGDLDYLVEYVTSGEAGEGEPSLQDGDPYFLGMTAPVHRTYLEGRMWAAAAFSSYCGSETSPGTIIAVLIERPEESSPDWWDTIIDSLDLFGGQGSLLRAADCEPQQVRVGDDSAVAFLGATVNIAVLDNDHGFFEVDPTSLEIIDQPAFGSAVVDGEVITYQAPMSPGEDVLSYRVCDPTGLACGAATVTVSVVEPTITDLVTAPVGPECGAGSLGSVEWADPTLTPPIEVWTCVFAESGIQVEYLRFEAPAVVDQWADSVLAGRGAHQAIADGPWKRGRETVGRYHAWTEEDPRARYAILWTYESASILAYVWSPSSDIESVDEWWKVNA